MKHTFIHTQNHEPWSSIGTPRVITMESDDEILDDLLDTFRSYLLACGFSIDVDERLILYKEDEDETPTNV